MSDALLLELTPPRVEVEPGGASAEAALTLHNLSNVVEQYTTEVVGLDPEWYTAPVSSVGLFPQDRDQVRVTFHPPKRPGMRAGSYPFRVLVRSRGGTQTETVDGVLDVRGYAVYRMDVSPRRRVGRKPGKYTVSLTNTGTADARLQLEAKDPEDALQFRFPKEDAPFVGAGSKIDVPLVVRANERPMIGAEKFFDFIITSRPQDARGEPQAVTAQYAFRPRFASWGPIRTAVQLLLVAAILFVIADFAVSTGVARQLPFRMRVASAQFFKSVCSNDLVKGFCPASAIAAKPEPDPEACNYDFGFKEFFDAEQALIGPCATAVDYDGFGNGLQYTKNGLMVWVKASNTVYYFGGDSIYAYVDQQTRLLDGPGKK